VSVSGKKESGELHVLLARIDAAIVAQSAQLAAIEKRLAAVQEQCQRTGETTTRLKLVADNARDAANAQSAAIAEIAAKLKG
jgi:hypothetical protein